MANLDNLIGQLEQARDSRVVFYCTGDRKSQESQIGHDVLPVIARHLKRIGKTERLDLLIYSRGGDTLTGFALANSLREFGNEVNVLVPFRAHSCATLIALSADHIVAGPFAQLSPIDPSITTPHGPSMNQEGVVQFLPVSVEDVASYIELARQEAGLKADEHMATVFEYLARSVNPLALGAVYRARTQIGMLANKLLALHSDDTEANERIVRQLTRELLSHDYIISRREAKTMGMSVVDAGETEAELMWKLYEGAASELNLGDPWNLQDEVLRYNSSQPVVLDCTRAILQSSGYKHVFASKLQVTPIDGQNFQVAVLNEGSWQELS